MDSAHHLAPRAARPAYRREHLTAARTRVGRAEQHIEALRTELAAFLTPACFRASIERHPRTGRNTVQAVLTRSVPLIIPALIGDVVHNTRAALDMAVAQLVKDRIGYAPRHIRFPFHASREALHLACRREGLDALPPACARAIIEDICPYQGGDEDLCALHELDILDRQFPLVPRISIVELRNMDFEDLTGTIRFRLTALVDDFGHVHKPLLTAGGRLRLLSPGQAIFAVLFPPGVPMAGRPLVATLAQFVQSVTAAIARLEGTNLTPIR
jgi:hypothetical protein